MGDSKWQRPAAATMVVLLGAVMALSSGAPAWAAPKDHDRRAADAAGRLQKADPGTVQSQRVVRFSSNKVMVASGVEVAVDAQGTAASVDQVAVLDSEQADFVARAVDDGVQIAAVIPSGGTALTQRYTFTGKYLEALGDGRVIVRNGGRMGEPVAIIDAPWAKDADGKSVPTQYRINGDTLIQIVSPGAAVHYPVVADPRIRTAWYGWSIDFTREDTRKISTTTKACTVVAGTIALAGAPISLIVGAVAAACGALGVAADLAVPNGKCVSTKILLPAYGVVPWITTCYQ